MKKIELTSLTIVITVFTMGSIFPQDCSKIIILSKRVGTVIDRQERDYFELFKNFDSFNSAVFYQSPEGDFYCKIIYGSSDSLKDTTFIVKYGQLVNTAMRITYFEELKKGVTGIDPNSIGINYASCEEIKNQSGGTSVWGRQKLSGDKLSLSSIKINPQDLIKQEWQYGVSAGMGYNSADFNGLSKIFNILEEKIPQEGYSVTKSNLKFSTNPLFILTGSLFYKDILKTDIEYSFSRNENKSLSFSYKSFSVSISYLFHLFDSAQPYVTAGYIGSSFTAKNDNYNDRVDDYSGTLKSITIDGNSKGLKIGGGVILNCNDNAMFNFYCHYDLLPNIIKIRNDQGYDLSSYSHEVKISGFVIGISLIYK